MYWLGVAPQPLKRNHMLLEETNDENIMEASQVVAKAIYDAVSRKSRARAVEIAEILYLEQDGVSEAVKVLREELFSLSQFSVQRTPQLFIGYAQFVLLTAEEVLLENVELILEAFEYLQRPIARSQARSIGHVGNLSIKIPWKKLGGDPITITLEDVFVCASQRNDQEWSSDVVEKREFAGKKAKLAAAELAKLSRRVFDSPAGNPFSKSYIAAKVNRSGELYAEYSISAELTDVVMSLNIFQLQQILILLDYLQTSQLRERYGRYRPCSTSLSRKPPGWQKLW
ncbi:unnamed protein product [Microthlaspi erraticum]|uniref:Uncharacterized protein n=2 Tax=Microthlaspi erraticum TaxID=1685480 RepID=A0A6D2ICG4_9BRAS|nr:unnamed protein product [Microthlaspi erraticum]